MTAVTEELVRLTAYKIWQEEGCPDGRADEHWLKACALLKEVAQPKAKKRAPTRSRKKAA